MLVVPGTTVPPHRPRDSWGGTVDFGSIEHASGRLQRNAYLWLHLYLPILNLARVARVLQEPQFRLAGRGTACAWGEGPRGPGAEDASRAAGSTNQLSKSAPTHQATYTIHMSMYSLGVYSPRSTRNPKLDPSYVHMQIATLA